MPIKSRDRQTPLTVIIPVKITFYYLIAGGIWILFSDHIVASLVSDIATLTTIQMFKGWFYVIITAIMLYILVKRNVKAIYHTQSALKDSYIELESAYEQLTATEEELKQQFDELIKSNEIQRIREEQYRILFECNPHPMWVYDQDTLNILAVNDAAISHYGFTRSEFLSMTIQDICLPDDTPTIAEQIVSNNNFDLDNIVRRHRKKNGSIIYAEIKVHAIIFGTNKANLVLAQDITERRIAEAKIQHLVYHDPLTNLPNRILLHDRLTQAISHAQHGRHTLAIIFIDINRFKNINDAMGHAAGDQLLIDVSKRIESIITKDATSARIGDDEFVILLPVINHAEDAAKIADNVFAQLQIPFVLNQQDIYITASIGIAIFPTDGHDATTLLKNADIAMHRAKETGGNTRQFYSPSMNRDIFERINLENYLRHAIDRDEFELYYQPQINTKNRRINGVEALIRWHHPQRGLLTPSHFIEAAEETGVILPLGEWVLRTACAQNKLWQAMGLPPVTMAVNLSAIQFQHPNLTELVSQILTETGLSPHFLILEITESTAIKDIDFTIKTLTELQRMGVQISIDDFGTGYSSLSYLKRLPINTLKIDRSFITDIVHNHVNASIVKAIIMLAQNLNLKTIAEGVETEEQMEFFIQQSCTGLQGYFFSKPIPVDAITEILKQNS